jgi:hypothetical protein
MPVGRYFKIHSYFVSSLYVDVYKDARVRSGMYVPTFKPDHWLTVF